MINVAIIGAGGWGKNLIRNFAGLKNCKLHTICDLDPAKLALNETLYPGVRTTQNLDEAIGGESVDAVVIASPAPMHFDMARRALEAGKHVYVEKPMTLSIAEAEQLVALADAKDRKLMVGHLLEYHPCVRKLKDLIDSGQLGDLYYMYCQRLNLGVVRKDENAWWSLAPHDVSVVLYLFGAEAKTVTSQGHAYLRPGVEDVVFTQIRFADGRMASIHVSWLDPHKIRKMTLVGTKKMATFDDMESSEKIRIYDKAADVVPGSVSYADSIAIRQGDIHMPMIKGGEPLKDECQHFVDAIINNTTPLSDGCDGLRVVKVLEAATQSLRAGGTPIEL
ncbi:MAG: Gfo/Idh/MocA family oxidoreductase [Planctomycetes bacterium]|nr:Gfo/Idh/MocA family oxidoreductase [Planctomycetota bacterium]